MRELRYPLPRPAERILLCTMTALPLAAHGAGSHYEVEDAELVETAACELETWHTRVDSDNHESAGLLTCNPLGRFEFGGGAGRVRETGDFYDTITEVNAKTLFAEGERWAAGLYAAGFRSHQDGAVSEWEVRLPVSLEAFNLLTMHFNAGRSWQRAGNNETLWGLGAEYGFAERLSLIAETQGNDDDGRGLTQGGLRLELGNAELDLGYGRERDSGDDRVTLGAIWHL